MSIMNIMNYIERDTCTTPLKDYRDSKEQLRTLFNNSCCYCTIHEGENHLGFFHVDHFKPKSKFSKLEKEYSNLYYACHKCNVHKKDNWLSIESGCNRDCDSCKKRICEEEHNFRFIDPCFEDPTLHLEFNSTTYELQTKNCSKAGTYTIEMLRLNRNQLTRLRKARARLLMWLQNEKSRLQYCVDRLDCAKEQEKKLENILSNNITDDSSDITKMLAEGLQKSIQQKVKIFEMELSEIELEIQNVSKVVLDRAAPYEW